MKYSVLSILFLAFILTGCTKKTNNNPLQPESNPKGSILLKIDDQTVPSGVVEVNACLSRANYDTVSASLNITSDSSAGIALNNIPAGDWDLKVDALDKDSVILYTGNTAVTVQAGMTTNINLTLYPSGNGQGSVLINVTWGSQSTSGWVDNSNNPVLILQNNYWDYDGVWESKVLYMDGIYKMWYMGTANNGVNHIGYAESSDGINWSRPYSDPVLSPGDSGSWDSKSISPGAVIYESGIYKMYYFGWANQDSVWEVGLATSSDGVNWNKYSGNPIIRGSEYWGTQIKVSSVLNYNGTYYLYYSTLINSRYEINLATSADGINWTKYSGNPVLTLSESWENSGVYYPSIIIENKVFKMVYMNVFPNTEFGMATSSDGIHWTKNSNNPIFSYQNSANGWANRAIGYPCLVKINNGYRIYYSGQNIYSALINIGFISKK